MRLGWKPSFPHPYERHHPSRIKAQMQVLKRWEVSRSAHQQVVKDRKSHSLHLSHQNDHTHIVARTSTLSVNFRNYGQLQATRLEARGFMSPNNTRNHYTYCVRTLKNKNRRGRHFSEETAKQRATNYYASRITHLAQYRVTVPSEYYFMH